MAKQIEGQDGNSQPVFQVNVRIGGLMPTTSELVDLLNQLLGEPAPVGSTVDRIQNLIEEFG